MDWFFVVLRRHPSGDDRRIATGRAGVNLQVLFFRYDRRVENVRVAKDFTGGRVVFRCSGRLFDSFVGSWSIASALIKMVTAWPLTDTR